MIIGVILGGGAALFICYWLVVGGMLGADALGPKDKSGATADWVYGVVVVAFLIIVIGGFLLMAAAGNRH